MLKLRCSAETQTYGLEYIPYIKEIQTILLYNYRGVCAYKIKFVNEAQQNTHPLNLIRIYSFIIYIPF